MTNITKSFGKLVANDQLNLQLKEGEILALLGENGAGKTTLMHILFGHYLADKGKIEVFGKNLELGNPKAALKLGLGIVHQHFALIDNLTVFENIILGFESQLQLYQKRSRDALKILADNTNFSVSFNKKVGQLSVGEKQKIEILKILYRKAKILILDEPTAVLTPQETSSLFSSLKKLTKTGISIIFISHKLKEIMEISERIYVLRRGRLVYETATKKASIAKLAQEMVGHKITKTKKVALKKGKLLLEMKNLSYSGKGSNSPLSNLSLELHQKEILGITGISGNGQKELAEIFFGLLKWTSGNFSVYNNNITKWEPKRAVQAGFGRIPEDRHEKGVIGSMTIWENLISNSYLEYSKFSFLQTSKIKKLAQELIEKFDIRCNSIEDRVSLLSGGNMQKLIIAREFFNTPQIIVAHQPTRGLDIGAIDEVYKKILKIRQAGCGIVLITEDIDELLELSDKIAVMYEGKISSFYNPQTISLEQIGLLMSGKQI